MKNLSNLFNGIKKAAEKRKNRQKSLDSRKLGCEELEDRCLLSVTALEYQAIREAFTDFNLANNINETNTIDVEELSEETFYKALQEACSTEQDDLIVLRASENEFFRFADSFENKMTVSLDYNFGAVNIIGIDSNGNQYNPFDLIDRHYYNYNGKGGYFNGDYIFSLPEDGIPDGDLSDFESVSAQYSQSWQQLIGLDDYYANSAYKSCDGSGSTIVVLDTGINSNHYLFKDKNGNSRIVYQYDFVYKDSVADDVQGHGSHCAGLAAGYDSLHNGQYSGVASGANIIALKVLDDEGNGSGTDIESALQWVLNNSEKYNIASVNMSLGGGNYPYYLSVAYSSVIDSLTEKGVAVCIATGNDFYELHSVPGVAFPACVESCISVGAVHSSNEYYDVPDPSPNPDQITYFTQRKEGLVDIFAPGANMWSASNTSNDNFAKKSGTSMATPVVAGVVAAIQSLSTRYSGTHLSVSDLLQVMQDTAVTIYDGDDEDKIYTTPTYAYYKRVDFMAMANKIYSVAPTLSRIALSNYTPEYGATISSYISKADATVTYQWSKSTDGVVWTDIKGEVHSSYTTSINDIGFYLKVTATGTGTYTGSSVSAQTQKVVSCRLDSISVKTNVNNKNIDVSKDTGASLVYSSDTVTVINTFLTPEGATASYQWFRGKSLNGSFSTISGAKSASYTLKEADAGYYLRVVATGTGSYTGTALIETVKVSIKPRIEFTSEKEDEKVSFNIGNTIYTTLSPAGIDPSALNWQWYRKTENEEEWTLIQGANATSYKISAEDADSYLMVKATPQSNTYYIKSAEAVSTEKVAQGIDIDFNTDIPIVGSPFTAEVNTSLTNFSCQWFKQTATDQWTTVGEAISSSALDSEDGYHYLVSYTPLEEDIGQLLKLEVTETDSSGTPLFKSLETGKSNPDGSPLTNPDGTLFGSVVQYFLIDHVALSSQTPFTNVELTALVYSDQEETTLLTENPDTGLILTYKWYRSLNGTSWTEIISARDSAVYSPVSNDKDYFIKAEVTGSNKCQGSGSDATSAKVLDKLETVTLSTDVPTVGSKINAVLNTNAFEVAWQWYRTKDANVTNFTDEDKITDATANNYTPVSDDVNYYIWAVAVPVNPDDNQTSVFAGTSQTVTQAITSAQWSTNSPNVGSAIFVTVYPMAAQNENENFLTYSWFRFKGDGSDTDTTRSAIENTEKTYTVTEADNGFYLRVIVTGQNGYSGTKTLTTTSKVTAKLTSISLNMESEPKVGQTLTPAVSAGNTPLGLENASFQWYRGTMVSDPQNEIKLIYKPEILIGYDSSYTLAKEDLGFYIGVYATGQDPYSGTVNTHLFKPVSSDTKAVLDFADGTNTITDPITDEVIATVLYGNSVTLSAEGSTGEALRYSWNLYGNGKGVFVEYDNMDQTGTADTVDFIPSINKLKDGDYTVQLKVTDASGIESIASRTIRVVSNLEAKLDDQYKFESGMTNIISAENSIGEEISYYYWDLGTNEYVRGNETVVFDKPDGQYNIRLKVVDSRGNISETSSQVIVSTTMPDIIVDVQQYMDNRLVVYNLFIKDSMFGDLVRTWKFNWGDTTEDTYEINAFSIKVSHYYSDVPAVDHPFSVLLNLTSSSGRWGSVNYEIGQQIIKTPEQSALQSDLLDSTGLAHELTPEPAAAVFTAASAQDPVAPIPSKVYDYAIILAAENEDKEKFNLWLSTLDNDSNKSDKNILQDNFLDDLEIDL